MSKVFSAKRNFVEFEYTFLDGTSAKLRYSEPSQKALEDAFAFDDEEHTTSQKMAYRLEQFKEQMGSNSGSIVTKILDEQREAGNIYDLKNELDNLLYEERKKK